MTFMPQVHPWYLENGYPDTLLCFEEVPQNATPTKELHPNNKFIFQVALIFNG